MTTTATCRFISDGLAGHPAAYSDKKKNEKKSDSDSELEKVEAREQTNANTLTRESYDTSGADFRISRPTFLDFRHLGKPVSFDRLTFKLHATGLGGVARPVTD
jgi:hypothetical protein